MENDLVLLIEKIIETKLEAGKQVGVISYTSRTTINFRVGSGMVPDAQKRSYYKKKR